MFSLQKKKRNEERKYPSFKHIHNSPILPSFVPTRNIALFFEAIFFRPILSPPPPPRFHHFQRGMRNIHEKTWARFFGISRGSESRIALRHSPLFHRAGIRSMCYVIGIAGGGGVAGRAGRKKGGIYFEQRRPSLWSGSIKRIGCSIVARVPHRYYLPLRSETRFPGYEY